MYIIRIGEAFKDFLNIHTCSLSCSIFGILIFMFFNKKIQMSNVISNEAHNVIVNQQGLIINYPIAFVIYMLLVYLESPVNHVHENLVTLLIYRRSQFTIEDRSNPQTQNLVIDRVIDGGSRGIGHVILFKINQYVTLLVKIISCKLYI